VPGLGTGNNTMVGYSLNTAVMPGLMLPLHVSREWPNQINNAVIGARTQQTTLPGRGSPTRTSITEPTPVITDMKNARNVQINVIVGVQNSAGSLSKGARMTVSHKNTTAISN